MFLPTRRAAQEPDDRPAWLLRARRERPRGCRAAEQRDELAARHSITSSARIRNVSGIAKPIAVLEQEEWPAARL